MAVSAPSFQAPVALGPSLGDTILKCFLAQSKFAGKIGECNLATAICDGNSRALVVLLCDSIRPSTIFRAVGAVVVNAVQRAALRSLPHILKKCVEHLPAFAYRDATPAVLWILRVLGVCAALPHRRPRGVSSRQTRALRMPVPWRIKGRRTTARAKSPTPSFKAAVRRLKNIPARWAGFGNPREFC